MKLKSKKFISLFLVFSLMMLSANLYAKERRGAKLIVTKKDGQQIEGELITVKPNSLLLLDTEGKDVSVKIEEIKTIRVVKKSKVWTGAGLGALIGGGSLAMYKHLLSENDDPEMKHIITAFLGLIGGVAGALVGGFIGASVGKDKIIQIEGMTDSEIEEALDKLRKKARIPDYPVTEEMPVYKDISIGLYLGTSTRDTYLYKHWEGADAGADLRYLLGLQVQYFFKNKNSGISFDLFSQNLKEHASGKDFPLRRDIGSAYFFSFNYDFRFFPNREKNFNPYLSLGYVFLKIEKSNYEEELYWPKKNIPIKLGVGLRYKIKDRFFVNSAFYYLPAHKFSSARIGLEYVF